MKKYQKKINGGESYYIYPYNHPDFQKGWKMTIVSA